MIKMKQKTIDVPLGKLKLVNSIPLIHNYTDITLKKIE